MEVYRKPLVQVEVYFYNGNQDRHNEIKSLLDKYGISYNALETEIPYQGKTYYKRSITFVQDENTFVLSQGKYLVHDTFNSFSTYTELRFKKLFDKVHQYGV